MVCVGVQVLDKSVSVTQSSCCRGKLSNSLSEPEAEPWHGRKTHAIDDFRGACAVKGNVQVAGRSSNGSTTEMLSTHDVTLRNVDGSLFHVQI